jgi:hypothetical protein
MIKPTMPNMPNMPGMGAMTDTLEFVKNLWSGMGVPGMNMPGMNLPGMVMPTLSVDEISKKIADLKAVESWLTLNMNMLRGTIQALEVQAATISTLQTMGESFSAAMQPGGASAASAGSARASAAASSSNGSNGYGSTKGNSGSNGNNGAKEAAPSSGAPQPTGKDESDAANLTAPLVNAAAWWNMLQDQFKQAVGNAMAAEPMPSPKEKPKAKSRTATASKSASTSSSARKRKPAR